MDDVKEACVGDGSGASSSTDECQMPTLDLEAAPHKGRVRMAFDVERGQYVVVCSITHQVEHVGAGPWTLECDEDGRGVLLNPNNDDQYLVLEDLFVEELMVSRCGWQYMQHFASDTPSTPVPLIDLLISSREARAELPVGPGNASIKFNALYFHRPRSNGNRVFLNRMDLHSSLNIKAFKGIASKWIFTNTDGWSRTLDKSLSGRQFCFS